MNPEKAKHEASKAADKVTSSAAADKAKGHVKEAVGTARAEVGKLVGSEEMEAKGHLQHAEGTKDRLKGELKESIDNAKDKVKAGVELVKDKIEEVRKR